MKNKSIYIIVAIAILASMFYQFFLKEYFAYSKVKQEYNIEACSQFIHEYPNGFFVEDVYFLQAEISQDINKVKAYIDLYPNGKYHSEINEIKNTLWATEINRYEQKAREIHGQTEAVSFFRELLHYMRDHNVYDIGVMFSKHIDLKNFEDYPAEAKQLLINDMKNEELPLNGTNILPLKKHFTQGNISFLEDIVANGISSSIDSLFTPGFVNIQLDSESPLQINIDYTIKNELMFEDSEDFPNIWTYSENNKAISYLLGIAISFDFSFNIPQNNISYNFHEEAEPSGTISDIEDIADGYARMTQITFALYANKISQNLGLDSSY